MHKNTIYKCISENDFSPRLLYSGFFCSPEHLPHGYKFEKRYVYDYELEFYVENSDGKIIDEDKVFLAKKGCINFRKPGELVYGIPPYSCYIITFDLLDNTGKICKNYNFCKQDQFQYYYHNNILDKIPTMYQTSNYNKYLHFYKKILNEFLNQSEASELLFKSYILQILFNLYREINNSPFVFEIPTVNNPLVQKSLNYIHKNINQKITVDLLAKHINLSPSYFYNIFKNTLGTSPIQYINTLKIIQAKKLLATSKIPIYEIALKCGFKNIPYFSYIFKKEVNISPKQYRQKYSLQNIQCFKNLCK